MYIFPISTLYNIMPRNSSLSSSSLKFGMWNIEGLNHDKNNDSYFNAFISNLHVISFVETWNDGSQDLSLPGFDLIHRNSRKRDKKARRNSSGISVYIKHGHSKGVKPLKTEHTDIAWTKLDHSHFKLKKIFTWHPFTSPLSILVVRYWTLNLYIPIFCKILICILEVAVSLSSKTVQRVSFT